MKLSESFRLIAAALVFVPTLLCPGGVARADQGFRTRPYDYGCLGDVPCRVQVKSARQGKLYSTEVPLVCPSYAPPFVLPCRTNVSTSAGIRMWMSSRQHMVVTATIRTGIVATSDLPFATTACLNASIAARSYVRYGCAVLRSHQILTLSTNFDNGVFPPGRHYIWVSLDRGPAQVGVWNISYRTSAA